MLRYNPHLKQPARTLRTDATESERVLWSRLRRKQIRGVPFYRQKPIGSFIVDFYSPSAGLVVEVDGSQHFEPPNAQRDHERTAYLKGLGLRVLRFSNLDVLRQLDGVVEEIATAVDGATEKIPLGPPSSKGEITRGGHR